VYSWDQYFIEIALLVAKKSKDESTKLGAVIVGPDNEIRSTGYNSFPRGLNDTLGARQERPEKYHWFEHSERNAIYNAARIGVSLKGCRMYLTPGPGVCCGCARAIIQSGVAEVILSGDMNTKQKWSEEAKRSMIMFEECGVKVRNYVPDMEP